MLMDVGYLQVKPCVRLRRCFTVSLSNYMTLFETFFKLLEFIMVNFTVTIFLIVNKFNF